MNKQTSLSSQLTETYQQLSNQLIEHLPAILGAILLIIIGWIVATLVRSGTTKLVKLADQYAVKKYVLDKGKRHVFRPASTTVLAKILYWLVLLFFMTAAANLLGWDFVTDWMNQLFSYLPKATAGLILIIAGIIAASVVRELVYNALEGTNALIISKISHALVILIAVFVGLEQLGINVQFVTTLISIILGVLLAGLALGFSFGAKDAASNIIAMSHIRMQYKLGDHINIDQLEGQLVDFTATSVILENEAGRCNVPARLFQLQACIKRSIEDAE